jgi:hypothetical protein
MSFFESALNKQQETRDRVERVGSDGVNIQDARMRKAKGDPERVANELKRRKREYNQGYVEKTIDRVKVIKHPENK